MNHAQAAAEQMQLALRPNCDGCLSTMELQALRALKLENTKRLARGRFGGADNGRFRHGSANGRACNSARCVRLSREQGRWRWRYPAGRMARQSGPRLTRPAIARGNARLPFGEQTAPAMRQLSPASAGRRSSRAISTPANPGRRRGRDDTRRRCGGRRPRLRTLGGNSSAAKTAITTGVDP